jgi:hypothetical protein
MYYYNIMSYKLPSYKGYAKIKLPYVLYNNKLNKFLTNKQHSKLLKELNHLLINTTLYTVYFFGANVELFNWDKDNIRFEIDKNHFVEYLNSNKLYEELKILSNTGDFQGVVEQLIQNKKYKKIVEESIFTKTVIMKNNDIDLLI